VRPLTDRAIAHLQEVVDVPDLSGTRYVLADRIGRGGMGAVFRARDAVLDREVAVKVCAAEMIAAPDVLLAEARILAHLEHPGIVPVHDAGVLPDGGAFYVMSLVGGERLDTCITRVPALSDRLRLFDRLCDVIAFAHAHGVTHRDLKPSNVLIGPFGDVRVVDWGLAARAGDRAASGGTAGYMAPEQRLGAAGARVDVYALGVLLRELSLGSAPTTAPRPKPLRSIVARATADDPDRRYESVAALAADVRRLVDGQAVLAHREGPLERIARLARTHRTSLFLVLAYLLMRLLLLAWRP
jgi:serine/threonine protein kinase